MRASGGPAPRLALFPHPMSSPLVPTGVAFLPSCQQMTRRTSGLGCSSAPSAELREVSFVHWTNID